MAITLITGANRGLGLALVKAALEKGDTVLAGVRTLAKAEALHMLQKNFGEQLQPLTLDVTSETDRQAAKVKIEQTFGQLDILIHNAGVNSRSQNMGDGDAHVVFGALTEDALLTALQINAVAPLLLTQTLSPLLVQGSAVVAISSWFASLADSTEKDFNYSYSGSKTLLNMYFRLASNALKPKGVSAFMVNPGWMKTDMGGAKASLTPEESANAIYGLAKAADLALAGQFLDWNGEIHPW